ncbi:MAG: 4Fe-4S binding protein, partial [Coriobacteriia bacterium]|nr:4Fe-4S binding protein [Coriobacteriia bacterium]
QSIAGGLQESEVDVVLHDLASGPPPHAAGFDLVGIGYPVQYFRMPPPARAAISALGDLAGAEAFAFILHSTYPGAGIEGARRALRRAHARAAGVFSCYGEGLFLGYTRLGYMFSPGHPDAGDLWAAHEFGGGLPVALADERSSVRHRSRTHWVYALERAALAPWLMRHVYSRLFHVDRSLCTRCGKCARVCPTGNITWERGALPEWGRDCVACVTCVGVCPESAIRCPLDWPVFRPFLRYNVARAARDPSIEHVRVELKRGKVVRIDAARYAHEGGGCDERTD